MALKRLDFRPGVNRESTSYAAEGTWYLCDKVRFRSGKPEKIGGWVPISANTFLGTARTMVSWTTNAGFINTGIGTHLKYYVENNGSYYDITPIRATVSGLSGPFVTVNGSTTVTVNHTAHGAITGDFVTFSGATGFNGLTAGDLNKEFQVTFVGVDQYTIVVSTTPSGSGSGGGSVSAAYQVNTGPQLATQFFGWGAGIWNGLNASSVPTGTTGWGLGSSTGVTTPLRLWNAHNYGQNLVYGPRGGPLYYWDASNLPTNFSNRGVLVSTIAGATEVPLFQNELLVSDTSRFVLVFGTNEIGSATLDPLMIRWSDQENIQKWEPEITNQAGGVKISSGSKIVAVISTKQEIVVFTDSAVYSMQYVGPPYVWNLSQSADNISVMSPNSMAVANNIVYWMGLDKFYMYSGRVETLPCSLRSYVFSDINDNQRDQVICGTNEGFTEIWWFYCSSGNNTATPDRYVVFNHLDRAWYYGTMQRTAWLDTGLKPFPMAIQSSRILSHEVGTDDNTTGTNTAMNAYIESADFDIDDGDKMAFCWRMLPDVTFNNSYANPIPAPGDPFGGSPRVTVVVKPRDYPGAPYKSEPPSAVISGQIDPPPETFTNDLQASGNLQYPVYLRFRGRQMAFRIESNTVGTQWQLGSPRIDIRSDGRKS
jgi:hypothetical protein